MPKIASLSRHGQFKAIGHPTDGLHERLPNVTKGLLAHFPFDGTPEPTPLLEVVAEQLEGVTHPDHPDLIKLSKFKTFTAPGITGSRYVMVEFDMLMDGTGGMPIGFPTPGGDSNMDLFVTGGRLGLNAWASQTWGALYPASKRVHVAYLIDTADTNKSKIYYDGVLQAMSGNPMTGAREIKTDTIIVGDGRTIVSGSHYPFTGYIGNIAFHRIDVELITATDAALDDEKGVFIGQPSQNLALTSAGATNFTLSRVDGNVIPITDMGDGRWRIDASSFGSGQTTIRLLWNQSVFTNGETYTTSLRYRQEAGPTKSYLMSDFCDIVPVAADFKKIAYSDFIFESLTKARATYDVVYRFTDILVLAGMVLEVWDIQLTKSYHSPATESAPRTSPYSRLNLGQHPLPGDHTLAGRRRSIATADSEHLVLTKSGDTFVLYENGVATTAYEDRWARFRYHRPTVSYNFAALDNLKATDGTVSDSAYQVALNQSTDKAGYLIRTFVYSDADVRIWHRYHNDNGGSIRVNGRDAQAMGGYTAPTGENAPDNYIDLKVGWNCVELWGMDGDNGGAIFYLTDNTQGYNELLSTSPNRVASARLSVHPNVRYQTAKLPVDFFTTTAAQVNFTRASLAHWGVTSYAANKPRFVRVAGSVGMLTDITSANYVLYSGFQNMSDSVVGAASVTKTTFVIDGASQPGTAWVQGATADIAFGVVPTVGAMPSNSSLKPFISYWLRSSVAGAVGKSHIRATVGGAEYYLSSDLASWLTADQVTAEPNWFGANNTVVGDWVRVVLRLPTLPAGALDAMTIGAVYRCRADFTADTAGFQLEFGLVTSLIPTNGAIGSRSTEQFSLTFEAPPSPVEGSIVVDWTPTREESSFWDQAVSARVFELGNYHSNSSLVLWAFYQSSTAITDPNLRLYIKGGSNSGWSATPTVRPYNSGWYKQNERRRSVVMWTNRDTFYVYTDGVKYGPWTIADPISTWNGSVLHIRDSSGNVYHGITAYDRMLTDAELEEVNAGGIPSGFTLNKVLNGDGSLAAADGCGYNNGFNSWTESLSVYDRALEAKEAKKLFKSDLVLSKDGRVTTPCIVENGENLWPDPDLMRVTPYSGTGSVVVKNDDGRYYELAIDVAATNSFSGYAMTNLEVGATYVFSGEFWRSSGSTATGSWSRVLRAEGVQGGGNVDGPYWRDLPEETWVTKEITFVADDSQLCHVYPAASNGASNGTFRWRNMVIRKVSPVPMSVSHHALTVNEIIEA
jgi:hypothetical protein